MNTVESMAADGRRITGRSFPTPDVVKTMNNPAAWDQLGGFAEAQAAEANAALALLDERLGRAATKVDRTEAFEDAFWHVTDWRYEMAAHGWTRPGAHAEDVRTPISTAMTYALTPFVGNRESGSPAFRLLSDLDWVARDRLKGADEVRNMVRLRDGRSIEGNLLFQDDRGLVFTETAAGSDRLTLRRAAFETLADLEAKRADAGHLDPKDPELRQQYADAANFLIQAPEVQRGSDAIMRTFLVAAHARVFDAAPVLPQAIDLDGMVRGQDAFNDVMRDQLRVIPPSTASDREAQEPSAGQGAANRAPRPRTSINFHRAPARWKG